MTNDFDARISRAIVLLASKPLFATDESDSYETRRAFHMPSSTGKQLQTSCSTAPINDVWSYGSQPTATTLLYFRIRNSGFTTLINSLPSRTSVRPIAASRHGYYLPIAALVLSRPEGATVSRGRQSAFPIKLPQTLRAVLRWTWTCP